eukprot:CAMPEP_0179063456 /NCGR_PEP_ID=MMETSP0796-20121207/27447_1 /TAXON_ID=73915 /ORGANISM="Pyrodinium bahamense, Strain pbaha01" /LENGTH=424 /DNA_ID=CAMNT_0020760383 /DNA_START=21 /DNA_END=1295 /DNA_ORIENTATION=+
MAPKRKAAADEGPAAKRAKAEPKATAKAVAPRVSEADLDSELNTMIQSAKDGEFDKVFTILDKYPPYVNERPEERMYSTIHQAVYWGDLTAIKKLVDKYNADVRATTKDGKTPLEVAKEHGHSEVVKYFEAQEKKAKAPPPEAGGRNSNTDRNRIAATRSDGRNDEADMELEGVKEVTLNLGAEGGGILCGAALVYAGEKKQKAVCYSDRKFKTGITHSGDSTDAKGRSTHTIKMDLPKMPKDVTKVYLTLCSCGPANLSKFKKPSVELLGDGSNMIRYDLTDAGKACSTVMAVLEKTGSNWTASPVGAISPQKFCGNYKAAEKLIESGDSVSASSSGKKGKKAGEGGGGRSLDGKVVVFTGTLTMLRSLAKSKAEEAGAKVTAAVSGNTDIVIYGPGAGDKLEKAKSLGCELWTEEEFTECVG